MIVTPASMARAGSLTYLGRTCAANACGLWVVTRNTMRVESGSFAGMVSHCIGNRLHIYPGTYSCRPNVLMLMLAA